MGLGFRGTTASKVGDISIKLEREEQPEFSREYSKVFPWGRVEWTIYNFLGRRWYQSSLVVSQRDRKQIRADADALADELIVPEVLADCEQFVKEVKPLDEEFMRSDGVKQFTDDHGRRWKQVE